MKKLLLIFFATLSFVSVRAPENREIFISSGIITDPYIAIKKAVGMVESNGNCKAYNIKEKAVGYFQIRAIRLRDYNERTGERLKLQDMYDYEKAERVFMYYASDFAPDDYEGISKEWNKSRTDKYWHKVKNKL